MPEKLKNQLPVFLLLLLPLLWGCSNLTIDNASEESRTVSIDGADHVLSPGGTLEISVDPGTHELEIRKGDSLITDTTFELREAGLINAGGTSLLLWRELYGLQGNRETLLNEEWLELDSVEYFGDFHIYEGNEYFLEKNWDYGLNQAFPASQKLMIFNDFRIESKIFREEDFVAEYERRALPTE